MRSLIRVALRNVARNRRRSVLTLLAVFLAVGLNVAVRGLLNGLQAAIRDAVVEGQTGALQIHRKGFLKSMQGAPLDLDVPADDAFLARVTAVPNVTAASPRIPFGGMANANDVTVFALFQGIDPKREFDVCPQRRDLLTSGRLVNAAAAEDADFADELRRRLGVKSGDTIAVLSNDHDGVLNAVEVKHAGELNLGSLPAADKKIAWLSLASVQQLLRMEGRATEIGIAVKRLDRLEETAAGVRAAVGPDYEVSTWHDVAAFVDDIIRNQNMFLGIILYTFLFVALIGIANTMLFNVLERTREIGTMMAVGMRRRQILQMFLVEAALLGLTGGVAGAALGGGVVLYFNLRGLDIPIPATTVPLRIHPFVTPAFILATFMLAATGAAIAALYPAWLGSRLRPIEALSRS